MNSDWIGSLIHSLAEDCSETTADYKWISPILESRLRPLLEAGEKCGHLYIEDCWYSCPKAEDYCGGGEIVCKCGKDDYDFAKQKALRL